MFKHIIGHTQEHRRGGVGGAFKKFVGIKQFGAPLRDSLLLPPLLS